MDEKFKKLQAKWRKKLAKSGFQDIENERGDFIDHQSVHDFSQRIGFRTGFYEAIRDYYNWASHKIIRGTFLSHTDKKIWSLHAEGKSSREIAEHINFDNTWISRKIKKIRAYLKLQPEEKEPDDAIEKRKVQRSHKEQHRRNAKGRPSRKSSRRRSTPQSGCA